jgi:adenine-specific DNA-methyltransferase
MLNLLTMPTFSAIRAAEKWLRIVGNQDNVWTDLGGVQSRADPKVYVVQTASTVIERCILMTTDPGDLVLDPTCGSGTSAYVAEQWGRRWITIDTSRVAVALARSRLMGARYPYYLLADSPDGQKKEAEVTRAPPKNTTTRGDICLGFVYHRVSHITLKSIANNAEIDVIWDRLQPAVEDGRVALNSALAGHPNPFKVETGGRTGAKIDFRANGEVTLPSGESAPAGGFMEWEIPREAPADWPEASKSALARFWDARIARQREIDASIAVKAEFEYLYDKPYADKDRIRVAGPFTVESLSPHRTLAVDWNDELIRPGMAETGSGRRYDGPAPDRDFAGMVLENLRAAGVQQAHKEDRIGFTSLTGWPGSYICAEGLFMEGDPAEGGKRDRAPAGQAAPAEALAQPTGASAKMKRAGIFIGPEFGTVSRPDLVAAAREAGDTDYNEESFFVRHAYFLGANDPYKALKTTLKAEIDQEAWDSLYSDTSRPFLKPASGRIAVKVINHLGDEVMKVLWVE